MRLTFKLIISCLLSLWLFFLSFQHQVLATCGGNLKCDDCSGCGGTQRCTTYGTYETADEQCGGTCRDITCWDGTDQNPTGSETNDGITYWQPQGETNVVCQSRCLPECDPDQSCISEEYTRSCTLPGCPVGDDPTPTPTNNPTSVIISGNIQYDSDAAAAGTYCSQSNSALLGVSGYKVTVTNTAAPSTSYGTSYTDESWYVNTKSAGSTYTVTLDLSAQTGETTYVCSCPAPVDPENPYLCRYTGVTSPSTKVNFYLKEYDLSNVSWFQVFGGNLFGRYGVADVIPYAYCSLYANCQAALSVPLTTTDNPLSSGFAVANTRSTNSVLSTDIVGYTHSFLHLAERSTNVNSYAVNTGLNELSYDYFYKLAQDSAQVIGNGEDLEPLLGDWTNASWWQTDETNFVVVNGNVNIDETQGFHLSSGQSLVVFVNGNLTIDDSKPDDSIYKITSVKEGGFLAFIVNGNITISADIGYKLNPANPTVPVVSLANSNLQGVFIADQDLTIQTKSDIGEVPPDRKFIGAGTFVGWHAVNLDRTFEDNGQGAILNQVQAVENFIYRPDFLANWPVKLKASVSNWHEIDPQLISE
jgi:hypothetical protein